MKSVNALIIAILISFTLIHQNTSAAVLEIMEETTVYALRQPITFAHYNPLAVSGNQSTVKICSFAERSSQEGCCLITTKSPEAALQLLQIASSKDENTSVRCISRNKLTNVNYVITEEYAVSYNPAQFNVPLEKFIEFKNKK